GWVGEGRGPCRAAVGRWPRGASMVATWDKAVAPFAFARGRTLREEADEMVWLPGNRAHARCDHVEQVFWPYGGVGGATRKLCIGLDDRDRLRAALIHQQADCDEGARGTAADDQRTEAGFIGG